MECDRPRGYEADTVILSNLEIPTSEDFLHRRGSRPCAGEEQDVARRETIARYIAESVDLLGNSSVSVFVPVLAHRLILRPESRLRKKTPASVVAELVGDVKVPMIERAIKDTVDYFK